MTRPSIPWPGRAPAWARATHGRGRRRAIPVSRPNGMHRMRSSSVATTSACTTRVLADHHQVADRGVDPAHFRAQTDDAGAPGRRARARAARDGRRPEPTRCAHRGSRRSPRRASARASRARSRAVRMRASSQPSGSSPIASPGAEGRIGDEHGSTPRAPRGDRMRRSAVELRGFSRRRRPATRLVAEHARAPRPRAAASRSARRCPTTASASSNAAVDERPLRLGEHGHGALAQFDGRRRAARRRAGPPAAPPRRSPPHAPHRPPLGHSACSAAAAAEAVRVTGRVPARRGPTPRAACDPPSRRAPGSGRERTRSHSTYASSSVR